MFQFTENQVSIPHDIVNVKKTLDQTSPLCLVLYKYGISFSKSKHN